MAQVVISEAEIQNETNIQNFGDSYVDYSFGSTLRSSDATSELQDYCPLDCVKRVFYGRQAAMTLIMMRTGDPDKAKSTVWTLYNDFAQGTYLGEYIEEREWVNAPKENIWILALTSDDYALGASYGSITILLRLHVPSTDNAYPQVQMISIFANLQLDKLRDAGFPP